jgi:signal peptidase
MVTHRIIRAKHLSTQPQYLTKGDANQDPDPQWVKKQQVVGRVTAVVPYLGYAILFTRSQPGFYLLVALPATLLSWDLITNIIASFY